VGIPGGGGGGVGGGGRGGGGGGGGQVFYQKRPKLKEGNGHGSHTCRTAVGFNQDAPGTGYGWGIGPV